MLVDLRLTVPLAIKHELERRAPADTAAYCRTLLRDQVGSRARRRARDRTRRVTPDPVPVATPPPSAPHDALESAEAPVGELRIRVPDWMRYELRVRALQRRMTLSAYCVGLLESALAARAPSPRARRVARAPENGSTHAGKPPPTEVP